MGQKLAALVDPAFIPHGYCLSWNQSLVALHVVSDLLIALCYFSIPVALVYFAVRRRERNFSGILLLFAAFIIACGLTHVLAVYTLWEPAYWLDGGVKAATAAVSLVTAFALWPLIPKALAMRSPMDLQQEIHVRHAAESDLRHSNEQLLHTHQRLEAEIAERREAERRAAQVFELAPHAMVITNGEGVITQVNSQLLSWFGYAREDLVGQPIEVLIPERFRPRHPVFRQTYAAAPTVRPMGTGRSLYARRKDGTEFPVDISLSAMQTGRGQELIASIADMTDRKRAEEALQGTNEALALMNRELDAYRKRVDAEITERRKTEERFTQMFERAPHATVIVNQQAEILLANAQLLAWFGYTREELVGKPIEVLIPERFRRNHPALRNGFMAAPSMRPMGTGRALFGLRKDGTEFPVDISLSPLQTPDGMQALASIVDMTERARTEEAARQLAALVESSADPILSKTLDGIVTSWNNAAERLFGFSAGEMIGEHITKFLPPERELEEAQLRERLGRGEKVDPIETVRCHKNGGTVDVSITMSPIRNDQGDVIGVSVILHDIGERRRADEAVRNTNAALEIANRELESFSYSVSHDLRQPVRALTGFTQILMEDYVGKLDAQGQDYLRRVQKAGERMGEMIDGLLGISRISRGDLALEQVDLSALCEETAEMLRQGMEGSAPQFAIAPGMEVQADPRLLRALMQNLLANAWKFSAGAPSPRIEVGMRRVDDRGVYHVKDNGAGFDMAYSGKLFGAFQRLHSSDQFPGTGIGLATAQRIVTRHGGRIWAEGKVGEGATFYFTISQ